MGRTGVLTLEKTGRRVSLASTDHHQLILDSAGDLVKRGTLAEYQRNADFLGKEDGGAELYRWKPEGPAAWGMSIDLNACIGAAPASWRARRKITYPWSVRSRLSMSARCTGCASTVIGR